MRQQKGKRMRVSIDHRDISHGLIFKKTLAEVICSVQFSAEELSVINGRKLKDYIVLERGWDATMQEKAAKHPEHYDRITPPNLKIGSLVKGPDRYVLDTPADAKGYEARLTEALKTLKGFLQANESKAESKSFEL